MGEAQAGVQTMAVRAAHRFDEAALQRHLARHLDGFDAPLTVRQFGGGQSNPTFLITGAGGREAVLRKKPPGDLLPSAHAVDREHRVIAALAGTGVPVPRTHHLCEDDSVIGTAFFVMERVHGRVLRDPLLPAFTPDERRALYDHLAEVLGTLHSVAVAAVGLSDYGRPGNYFARQFSRGSKQYRAAQTDDIPAMEKLIDWLPEHMPGADEPDMAAIVHGDYRIENTIVHPSEPRIVAVLDWELSTLGHPFADLAACCTGHHADVHGHGSFRGLDLEAMGLPSEREFLERYCRAAGRGAIPDLTNAIVFALFRSAAIVQGVYKRGLDGNASSADAVKFGDYARSLAAQGWALVDG